MLKVLKWVLIGVGAVLIGATIALIVWDIIQINHLVTTADAANMSTNANPRWWVALGAGGGVLGGFALGVGVGLPRRTFKQRLQGAVDADAQTA